MSDELHVQLAYRHAEESALLPWASPSPDEELMAKEEAGDEVPRRAWLQEVLLAFLFADGKPEVWENVALRAFAVFRYCFPGLLAKRCLNEVEGLERRAKLKGAFSMEELVRLSNEEEWREVLERILDFLYPARSQWLFKGTQRVYLLAREYQPGLLAVERVVEVNGRIVPRKVDMCYEVMAEIFEGEELNGPEGRDRARSRWSARAQVLLRKPIEEAGGVSRLHFGKSLEARLKMAMKAKGNANRKGGRGISN
jgi:hypothetical protein